jgi:hypothetical protein
MRKGISIEVTAADRARLLSIIRDGNSPQKHVWRARIIVLTADGAGTTAVMRAVGKGKTAQAAVRDRHVDPVLVNIKPSSPTKMIRPPRPVSYA